ncbi:heavy metal translocating P-type ATPase [Gracilibacillus halophilus YIM-C55.5]|uniref:Cd(2+)-exporting ATPase n=1 Tax=Gracilibacillus halophilus YIM-C55.5 TaxID=1308866 RepID=N4WBK2_9BACI|nr:heavy metal translocating P-type ATPase [Gracilibacillus halophilus YIM-C55.5]
MAEKQIYRLQGLSCTNCAAKFEKNVRDLDTVEDVELNFAAAKLTVHGHPSLEQLEKAGAFDHIQVYPEKQPQKTIPFYRKKDNQLTAVSLLFVVIGYVFLFQFGDHHGLTLASFASAIVIGGFDLMKTGVQNLFRFRFDMKTLMTIAVIGAVLIGEWAEAAVVVFLFALSEALENASMAKARDSIHSLMEVAPNRATIKKDNQFVEMDVDEVNIGDIMVVKPGEKMAMDGEVVDGHSSVNEAAITGESQAVEKTEGQEVFAGSLNEDGALMVRVTKTSDDSTIARIIHLVEEAQTQKAPAQQLIDRFAKYYTPAILIIALVVIFVPPVLFQASWQEWIYNGLAVLVVGCPCALVISTPVAIVTAIGNAARNGVLIKGGAI